MHIPWNWAKQRPQFLAEELNRFFDLTIMCPISYRSHNLSKDVTYNKNLHVKNFITIPFKGRFFLLQKLNDFFIKLQLKIINYRNKYDVVWITHPVLFNCIKGIKFEKIIYDCMDNALEFPKVEKNRDLFNYLLKSENILYEKANLIICSSSFLKKQLISRYGIHNNKIRVVNNGINLSDLYLKQNLPVNFKNYFNGSNKKIVYIGTISTWFDFDLLLESLKAIQNIDYLLFGPTEVNIPHHKNIIYCGPVSHAYVASIMSMADVLIIPFKITNLIKSVDPVKAYEYIFSGKPSLVREYEETKKFKKFVYLYNSNSDYIFKLKKILNGDLSINISNEERNNFVKNSDWSYRSNEIIKFMKEFHII